IVRIDEIVRILDKVAVARLAVPQGFFGSTAIGYVLDRPEHSLGTAVRSDHGLGLRLKEAVPSVGKDDAGLDVEEFSFLYRRDKAFRKDRTIRRADRIVNEFDRRFDRTRFVTEDPIDLVRPVDNIRGRIDAVLEFE